MSSLDQVGRHGSEGWLNSRNTLMVEGEKFCLEIQVWELSMQMTIQVANLLWNTQEVNIGVKERGKRSTTGLFMLILYN